MIEVKNVTKKYGKFIAVDNISFTINEGEIIGLLGPNGAGKSTTMNMLTGFIEQTEGEIIIDGYNTLKKPKKAKKEIGYMPEGVPLYTDLTVKEFITYMAEIKNVDRKNRKEKVQEIINKTGLKDVQKKLIKNLSRGYKQRVSMAGAKQIKFMCIVTCPQGLKAVQDAHPDVDIITGAIDEGLNENLYIVPGIGDCGDRLFGTK